VFGIIDDANELMLVVFTTTEKAEAYINKHYANRLSDYHIVELTCNPE
jgi:hypothetical protein